MPAGGEYTLDINSREQGSVTVRMSVDSLEIFTPAAAAPPPAATGKGEEGRRRGSPAAPQAPQYLAVFSPEPEGRAVVVGLDWAAFKKRVDELATRGLQLIDVETFEQGGKPYWSGIFRSTQQATLMLANQDWDTFLKNWKTATGSRKRLFNFTDLPEWRQEPVHRALPRPGRQALPLGRPEPQGVPGQGEGAQGHPGAATDRRHHLPPASTVLYAGAFHYEETPTEYWQALDRAALERKWQAAKGKMQLIDLETYKDGNERLFDAIVHDGTSGDVVIGLDPNAFTARWRDMVNKGYRPTDLKMYE